jgi:hypothetical protein
MRLTASPSVGGVHYVTTGLTRTNAVANVVYGLPRLRRCNPRDCGLTLSKVCALCDLRPPPHPDVGVKVFASSLTSCSGSVKRLRVNGVVILDQSDNPSIGMHRARTSWVRSFPGSVVPGTRIPGFNHRTDCINSQQWSIMDTPQAYEKCLLVWLEKVSIELAHTESSFFISKSEENPANINEFRSCPSESTFLADHKIRNNSLF